MNIKYNSNFIRDLLYLIATIRNGQITITAEQNGIKPSNLSRLLTELEKTIGCKLIIRSCRGIKPTQYGQEIYELALCLEHNLQKLENIYKHPNRKNNQIKLYISEALKINNFNDFCQQNPSIKIIPTNNEEFADVALLNHEPNMKGISFAKFVIGQEITQNIWVICNENNPNATILFDFIVSQLQL